MIEKAGIAFRFVQPHKGFNRRIGEFAGNRISPAGEVLTEEQWQAQSGAWLPNDDDMRFIDSLMKPCRERGKYASWIAPPRVGINNQPGDFPTFPHTPAGTAHANPSDIRSSPLRRATALRAP